MGRKIAVRFGWLAKCWTLDMTCEYNYTCKANCVYNLVLKLQRIGTALQRHKEVEELRLAPGRNNEKLASYNCCRTSSVGCYVSEIAFHTIKRWIWVKLASSPACWVLCTVWLTIRDRSLQMKILFSWLSPRNDVTSFKQAPQQWLLLTKLITTSSHVVLTLIWDTCNIQLFVHFAARSHTYV